MRTRVESKRKQLRDRFINKDSFLLDQRSKINIGRPIFLFNERIFLPVSTLNEGGRAEFHLLSIYLRDREEEIGIILRSKNSKSSPNSELKEISFLNGLRSLYFTWV